MRKRPNVHKRKIGKCRTTEQPLTNVSMHAYKQHQGQTAERLKWSKILLEIEVFCIEFGNALKEETRTHKKIENRSSPILTLG